MPSGADAATPSGVAQRRRRGAAATASVNEHRVEQHGDAAAVETYVVDGKTYTVPKAVAEKVRTSERMRMLGERRWAKETASPGSPPSAPPDSDIPFARADLERSRLSTQERENELKGLKAEREILKLTSQGEVDPVERELARTLQVLQIKALLSAQETRPGPSMNDVVQGIQTGINLAKPDNGSNRLLEILLTKSLDRSDAETLQKFAAMGLVQGPNGQPTSELGARVEIARMQVQRDARQQELADAHRHAMEAREETTAAKLVDLAAKGIDTIAAPLGRAFAENVAQRRWLPGDIRPGDSRAPLPSSTSTSPSPSEQLAKIDAHLAEVYAVREKLAQQAGVTSPSPPSGDPIAAAFRQSMAKATADIGVTIAPAPEVEPLIPTVETGVIYSPRKEIEKP